MKRRRYLTLAGGMVATLAGCSSAAPDGEGGEGGAGTPTEVDSPTVSPTATPTPTNSPSPTATPTPTPTPTPPPTPTPIPAEDVPGSYDADRVRANARSPSYEDLFREFEAYEGEPVYFEHAQVYQVVYDGWADGVDYLQLWVANNDEEFTGDIAGVWAGDQRLLENDYLELWGVPERLYEYQTTNGDWRTIPLFTIVDVELYE